MIPLYPAREPARSPQEWQPGGARPFLLCALPRSRTAWLANWLTHGRVRCAHELCTLARTPAELPWLLRRAGGAFSGNADTAQVMVLPRLLEAMPHAAVAVVRRASAEVIASLRALGFPTAEAAVRERARHLDAAARLPGALVLEYEDLQSESAARALLAHVAPGEPFDRARWAMLGSFQVQPTPAHRRGLLHRAETQGNPFLSPEN